MSKRPLCQFPEPWFNHIFIAGERIKVGACVELRRYPENRNWWRLYNATLGAMTAGLIVIPKDDETEVEEGEDVLVRQCFGHVYIKALLKRGERVQSGVYERGHTVGGTDLISGGNGTVIPASRFTAAKMIVGNACETVDLTDAEEDRLILIRTQLYLGDVAVAG